MGIEMRVAVLTVAAACLLLAGCSSSGGDTAQPSVRPPESGLDSTSTPPPPTSTTGGDQAIQKKVGELAAIGCRAGQANCTDLMQFTVTDISPAAGCSAAPPAGKAFLHVAASASTAPTLPADNAVTVGSLLNVSNWQVLGSDGYTSTNLQVATSCTFDAGPFYDTMRPGIKERGDIAFIVPAGARSITLAPQGASTSWVWQIPA